MKKWFIALLFVFACLPVVAVKAAPPQTYILLDYETINNCSYNIGDGNFENRSGWRCSNKIQIPKNIDKLYFSDWYTHFVLFYNNETYIGFYYDEEFVFDVTFEIGAEEKILGTYDYTVDLIHMLDAPANATHILLQSCYKVEPDLSDYMVSYQTSFNEYHKPLIYYPAPADAATNMTFNLMPALMIMLVIAGITGGLIMITKKSKR